jgi:putative phosphoesterase
MKLAVISDSHNAYDDLRKFLNFLKREGIRHLVHAGDFVTSDVSDLFAHHPEINCYIAIGNCDYGITLRNMQKMPQVMIDTVVYFELEGRFFAVSHIDGVAERALKDQPVDVFFHGHTHTTRIDNHQHPMMINPGSLMDGHGFILMDVPSLDIDHRFLFD